MALATGEPTKNGAGIPLDSIDRTTLSRLYSDREYLADCFRVAAEVKDNGQAVRKVLEQCKELGIDAMPAIIEALGGSSDADTAHPSGTPSPWLYPLRGRAVVKF